MFLTKIKQTTQMIHKKEKKWPECLESKVYSGSHKSEADDVKWVYLIWAQKQQLKYRRGHSKIPETKFPG